MSNYIKVEGHTSLIRDEHSSAIVNTDINAYRLAKKRRELFKNQTEEINSLREEMSELKNLMKELLEKTHG